MKKIFFALAVSIIFFSCEKEHHHKEKNLCPVVAADLLPQVVKESFSSRYPATTVDTWFYKDSSSYCALFFTGAEKKLAHFELTGAFIKEETKHEHDCNHDDEDSDSTIINPKTGLAIKPCECKLENEDH